MRPSSQLPTRTQAAEGFHPGKTKINDESLAEWLKDKVDGDLQAIPGIGAASEKKIKEAGIENSFQLIGKFLMLKDDNVLDHALDKAHPPTAPPSNLRARHTHPRAHARTRAHTPYTRTWSTHDFPATPQVETHMDAFFAWLKDAGINAHRNTIVLAVAEKVRHRAPGWTGHARGKSAHTHTHTHVRACR